jgi:hypothetical protein
MTSFFAPLSAGGEQKDERIRQFPTMIKVISDTFMVPLNFLYEGPVMEADLSDE